MDSSKMHCFICVTYMIILCSAHPAKNNEVSDTHQKRSLFRDVIESFRIRAQLPENLNQNIENNLNHNFEQYGYENELPQLPGDTDFIPRRNDRIEMPPLKYRFPKSLSEDADQKATNATGEEVVVYINTNENKVTRTTQKPKKQKRPQPGNKNKSPNRNREEEIDETATQIPESLLPLTNTMTGQSQIGNRESQTVVKPTVIVNFRGTLSHRDSDIRIESRTDNDTLDTAQNIFNINQEVNFENRKDTVPKDVFKTKGAEVKQQVSIKSDNNKPKIEEDMIMCETATWHPQKNIREGRKPDSVLQILFSL